VDDIDPENLPEGWRNGILGEVVNIRGGGTPSTTEPKFWNGSIFWTSPKDLSNQKSPFLIGTEKKITELGLKKVSSGLLPEETILMSSRAPIGYIAISDVPVAINQGYIAILPDSKFSTHFMYFWLKNNLDLIIQYANGSTFLEISKNAFREIEVIIPPDNLIEKFIQSVRPNFDFIKNSTYETTQLKKIRDYLLPKLISGDIIPSDIQTIEKAL
jgi:type I restriction enzyme S subunit